MTDTDGRHTMVTQLVAATLMVFAVFTAAALAVLAWRQRPRPGAVPFAAIMLAVTAWVGAYSAGFWSTGLETKLFWYRLEWLGVVSLPVAWIGFAAEYTGRDRYLTPKYVALLSVVPALTVLLAWTNPAHHLVLTSASVVTYGEFAVLERNWGPWFWVHIVYSYSLLVAGAALLFRLVVDSRTLYRGQATALLVAVGAPWVGNVAYVTDLTGLPGFDPTPSRSSSPG
ncbi:histidine kinase N-terminal 7TM domain-containing protein [Halobacteriaceae archaeon GCM10025711]